jgi:hypothetical protein
LRSKDTTGQEADLSAPPFLPALFFLSSLSTLSSSPIFSVHGLGSANTHAIYGQGADKELTELVPGIINQLGPDSLASLRKLAESYQAMNAAQQMGDAGKEDDDEVPDVVSARQTEESQVYPT